jgi:serine/threonine protein phosphatase PrpC
VDVAVSDGSAKGEVLVCAECGEEAAPGDQFCERCGAQLPGILRPEEPAGASEAAPDVTAACTQCGGTEFQDGYCTNCGAPVVRERDHWSERPAPWLGAVTDRGVRHHRNEDAMAVGVLPDGRAVLVVCDGVSSSLDSDVASLAAARAARDVLVAAGPAGPSPAARISHWSEALAEASEAANAGAVEAAKHPTGRPAAPHHRDSPPSCTFVAAVVDGPVVVVGSIGDSRAYWLPDAGEPGQLTVDDSWAAEAMQAGMARAAAESSPQAHAITRWLGSDSPDSRPRCAALTPEGPGWLMVCSDGLWNYCSAADDLAALLAATLAAVATAAGAAPVAPVDPVEVAGALVNWANAQGGQDNITVALARLEPSAEPAQN